MLKQRKSGNITEQKIDLGSGEQFLLPFVLKKSNNVGRLQDSSALGAPLPTYPQSPRKLKCSMILTLATSEMKGVGVGVISSSSGSYFSYQGLQISVIQQ